MLAFYHLHFRSNHVNVDLHVGCSFEFGQKIREMANFVTHKFVGEVLFC